MRYLAASFALLVAIAGWHYLFYSKAAHRLEGIEDERLNRKRITLRRIGGGVMLALAGCFLSLFWSFDLDTAERVSANFFVVLLAIFALLAVIVVLALIDLRLTHQLRKRNLMRGLDPRMKNRP
jgi:hypothetical protein